MKRITATAALVACMIAPAAQAADMCKTIKAVLEVGRADKTFASLQSVPYVSGENGVIARSQINGFLCKVSVEEGRGYFACSRNDVKSGVVEAAALSAKIKKCLAVTPKVEKSDYSTGYTFVVRAQPELNVYLSGSTGKLLFLNVVAY